MQRLETRLDGPILIEPNVFGDERGFFCETYRRSTLHGARHPGGVRPGQPLALGPRHRARHALPDRPRRGQARALRARRDLRRGRRPPPRLADLRAVGGLRADRREPAHALLPVGFAHGFCVLSDVADVLYKQDAYYDDATERGIKYDDPDVGIEWPLPVAELKPSERDADAPTLREIAADLPFVYRG